MEDSEYHVPVDKRTPIAEAGVVLDVLADIYTMWGFGDLDNFVDIFIKPMWADESTSGECQIQQIIEAERMTEWEGKPITPAVRETHIRITILMTSCAFAIQAMKANKMNNVAWAYVSDARYWLGILLGRLCENAQNYAVSELARKGANARHAENKAMKAQVFSWCDANMERFRSMDKAAGEIAGKLVPVAFRTAREWIGDWNKLRSAGKA